MGRPRRGWIVTKHGPIEKIDDGAIVDEGASGALAVAAAAR